MNHTQIFEKIAHLACRRYGWVLMVAAALTVLSWVPPVYKGMRNSFDLGRMLPQEIPAMRAFTRAITDFGGADDAVVVFYLSGKNEKAGDPIDTKVRAENFKLAAPLADRIVERLRKNEDIEGVFCRKYTKEEKDFLIKEELPKRGLVMLSEQDIAAVEHKLQPDVIRASVRHTANRLRSVVSSDKVDEMTTMNALGIAGIFNAATKSVSGNDENSSEYIVDKDRTMLLLVAQPKYPAQSIAFASKIMGEIEKETRAEIEAQAAKTPAVKDLRVEFGGGYEAARTYASLVHWILFATLLCSTSGVVALFGFCYRRIGVVFYIGIPLLMVVSWTGGLGCLIFGQLNVISCSFAAVLMGLGIDYAIHIYNRYVEERGKGESVEESFRVGLSETGWGVLMGMATTCAAFASLLTTRFSQLAEFGVMGAMGIALSAPVMLFILPALITWRNIRRPEPPRALKPVNFFLPKLATLLERRRHATLFITVGMGVICVLLMIFHPVGFDDRMALLRPQQRAFELNGEIAQVFSNRNPNKLLLLAYGDNETQALEEAAKLTAGCDRLLKKGLINDYESVMRYLPAPSEQHKRLEQLSKIDFDKATGVFKEALKENGLTEDAFQFNFDLLRHHAELVKHPVPVLASDFASTPVGRLTTRFIAPRQQQYYIDQRLPEDSMYPVKLAKAATSHKDDRIIYPAGTVLTREQVHALVSPSVPQEDRVKLLTIYDHGWSVKINIYPPVIEGSKDGDPKIDNDWLAKVKKELGLPEKLDPDHDKGFLTGVALLSKELASVVKEDFERITLGIFGIAVLVLAIFYYKHPVRVIYSLMPLSLGLLYCFGIMSISGMKFDFINILSMPIILGISVDNGIHFVNRYFDDHRQMRPMVEITGRGMLITALANNIGFESLLVSGYQGLNSLGNLTALASTTVIFASLVAFPVILATLSPRKKELLPAGE